MRRREESAFPPRRHYLMVLVTDWAGAPKTKTWSGRGFAPSGSLGVSLPLPTQPFGVGEDFFGDKLWHNDSAVIWVRAIPP